MSSQPEQSSLGSYSTSTLTFLVVASMIGAGVYTTSGFAMADLQSPTRVMLAWMVGGVIALSGAICYGQLAERLTENGGEYLYLSRFLHPAMGCVAGWVSLLAGFTGAGAFAALTFEAYAIPQASSLSLGPTGSIAILSTLLLMAFQLISHQRQAWLQNGIVLLKLFGLIVFLIIALKNWPQVSPSIPPTLDPVTPFDLKVFATSVMWISLSYCGFNAAIYVAGDAQQQEKGVRRSLIGGTCLVTALYLVLNAVFVYGTLPETITGVKDIAAVRASQLGGLQLEWFMRSVICLGLLSSVSSVLMTGPRVYAKMADDGVLPKWMKSNTPSPNRMIWFQGLAICLVISLSQLKELLSYLGLTLSLCAAATVSTLLLPSTHSLQWWQKIPALLYVGATLTLSTLMGLNRPQEAIACVVTFCLGLAHYGLLRWQKRAVR